MVHMGAARGGKVLQILRAQALTALTGALMGAQNSNLSWGPTFLVAPLSAPRTHTHTNTQHHQRSTHARTHTHTHTERNTRTDGPTLLKDASR